MLALGSAGPARALTPDRLLTQYPRRTWSVTAGLPQSHVRAFAQTPDRYLWIATEGGLARFDGASFAAWDVQRVPLLSTNSVRSLQVDRTGTLRVGLGGGPGLVTHRDGRFSLPPSGSLPGNSALALLETEAGTLWVGTYHGLVRVRGGVAEAFGREPGAPPASVQALAACPDGTVWSGNSRGELARIREDRAVPVPLPPSLGSGRISALACARDGTLWIGSLGGGVARLAGETLRVLAETDGLPSNRVRALMLDAAGTLWVGTQAGLARVRGDRFESFPRGDDLARAVIEALAEDAEGNVWIGTWGGGITRLGEGPLFALTAADGLPLSLVSSVHETRDGALWIGSHTDGLARYHRGAIQHLDPADGSCGSGVTALWEDREGALWIGGNWGPKGGLCRFAGGRFQPVAPDDEEARRIVSVRAIYQDRDHRLWLGGASLLVRSGLRFSTVVIPGRPAQGDDIYSFHQDRRGRLWVGSETRLRYLEGDRWEVVPLPQGLLRGPVRAILESARGDLWLATQRGLVRVREGSATRFDASNGLFDTPVFSVQEGAQGDLWVSTAVGLFRWRGGALAGDRVPATALRRFGAGDGMNTDACEGGHGHSAGFRGRDGRIWFPTAAGVVMVDPARQERPRPQARAIIEAVLADGRPVAAGETAPTMAAGQRDLEIRYTKPSFTAPEAIRFRYRLDGFDPDWVDAGGRRAAFYTRLPPGRYQFRLQATDAEGVFGAEQAGLTLEVEPRLHQRLEFRVGVGLVLLLLAWLGHRFRLSVVESRHAAALAERNRIARDLHDTLAQSFTAIAIHLEAARNRLGPDDETRSNVESAQQAARQGVEDVRNAIWDMRAQALPDGGIVKALEAIAARLAAEASVRVVVRGRPHRLSARQAEVLVRVGEEAITNAIRHGRPKSVDVELSFEGGRAKLRINDDGAGFDVTAPRPGHFGLDGISERVARAGGRLSVRSEPGAGTEILVDLPER